MTRQDSSFFLYLQTALASKKQITTNQHKLFDKLVIKLRSQFNSHGYDAKTLINLPWNVSVVTSTQPTIKLVENSLIIETPFDKKFIDSFNKGQSKRRFFQWDPTQKNHKGVYSTVALKFALQTLKKHFNNVVLCPSIKEIISTQVEPFDLDLIWNPTLVKVKDTYLIAANNKIVNDLIEHLPLNSDPKNLFKLSKMGVVTHSSITDGDPLLEFASLRNPVINVEQIDEMCEWLSKLNIDTVLISRELIRWLDVHSELSRSLSAHGIKEVRSPASFSTFNPADDKDYAVINIGSAFSLPRENVKKCSKYISLKNSRPITIK